MNTNSELHAKLQTGKTLLGCSVETISPAHVEMAGMLGFDLIWLDLEHGIANFDQVQTFCIAAKAGGAWPMVRIPSAERTHIMRALEAGARLVVVPMVESPETSRKIVEHGKYKPVGNRGFAGSFRGMNYGIGSPHANMEWANRETHLFVQIETVTALQRCAEIVAVEGITGGIVGPADLSVSMGKPVMFDDPAIADAVGKAVRTIREQNKIAILVSGHPKLMKAAVEAGVQGIVCAGERPSVRAHWQQTLKDMATVTGGSSLRQTKQP